MTATVRRPRAWQRMLSGGRLDLLDPRPGDIAIEDIAHGLARVARWNGQTSGPHIFSVAQHSLLVEAIFSAAAPCGHSDSLTALLHDAPEYVVGDLISPFKAVLADDYKAVEHRILSAVHDRYGLNDTSSTLHERIKQADRAAARLEATALAGFSETEADLFFGRPEPDSAVWRAHLETASADTVKDRFLQRFFELHSRERC